MSWLFGKKKTPQGMFLGCLMICCLFKHSSIEHVTLDITELLRENKRMLDKAIRELDRERMALQNQEKKVIAEIKKTAKQGQMVLQAKSVISLILRSILGTHLHPSKCRTLSRSWPSHLSGIDML